ncbi:uncharacterized protein LOC119350623 [Triticum dicoccoides]|uniref:uncharacterized protein LOC119350623 n=1 Tax=Triticum dicoccoides TaxID=85692 RepID=UPI00188F71D2|nr:uncharacterized protein LOC119350623 [Triticum dicoccoides]
MPCLTGGRARQRGEAVSGKEPVGARPASPPQTASAPSTKGAPVRPLLPALRPPLFSFGAFVPAAPPRSIARVAPSRLLPLVHQILDSFRIAFDFAPRRLCLLCSQGIRPVSSASGIDRSGIPSSWSVLPLRLIWSRVTPGPKQDLFWPKAMLVASLNLSKSSGLDLVCGDPWGVVCQRGFEADAAEARG